MDTLLLIDGNAIMHRAFHALPPFKTKEGIPTHVVYGFFTMLHKSINDYRPDHVVVCFDTPVQTFRNKMFKKYQAQRPQIDNDFIVQIPIVKEALDKAAVVHLEKDGFEADDLIGTIAHKFKSNGIKVLILSGDRDILQLVDHNVFVITPQLGLSNLKIYDVSEVQKKYGLVPQQIPDLKALMGDPSDNYPGAKGIGPKTAAKLLQEYKTIENLYTNLEKLEPKIKSILIKDRDDVFMSKKLAKIITDVDIKFEIEKTRFEKFNQDLKDYFLQYQMKSLVGRLFKEPSSAPPSPKSLRRPSKATKRKEKKNENQMGLF